MGPGGTVDRQDIQAMTMTADTKPLALQLLKNFPILSEFQHFTLDQEIVDFCAQIINGEMSDGCASPFPAPLNSHPPSPKMTISVPGHEHLTVIISGLSGQNSVGVAKLDSLGRKMGVGGYFPGGAFSIDRSVPADQREAARDVLVEVAFHLAIINQPRVVEKSPSLSRQQRRAYHRGMGFAVDAWHRISWDLSKATKAKLARDPSFHPKPYHFCRGHLRRAEKHYKGAFQLVDAIRPEDREGWWQWIDECWKGHPAFGVKKSVHAPRMTSGRLALREKTS